MPTASALSERCVLVGSLLSPAECAGLIALAEAAGFEPAPVRLAQGAKAIPTIRNNARAQLDLPQWPSLIWERLAGLRLPSVDPDDGAAPAGLPASLRFYRYGVGERFKMHKDGVWEEDGLVSRATLLIYLNEDFQGGRTVFRGFEVAPKTGSAVVFAHKEWHEGEAVLGGVKYAMRSDLLYPAP